MSAFLDFKIGIARAVGVHISPLGGNYYRATRSEMSWPNSICFFVFMRWQFRERTSALNWQSGDDVVIVPSITDEAEFKKRFPKGFSVLTPYLRLTPQPNK